MMLKTGCRYDRCLRRKDGQRYILLQFGSVGQNEIDNNVGTYKYENQLIPEIAYVSDSRMIAVSDQNIMVFDGSQKPKLKQTIKLEKLIDSVFYNNKYIGVAYSNNDKIAPVISSFMILTVRCLWKTTQLLPTIV